MRLGSCPVPLLKPLFGNSFSSWSGVSGRRMCGAHKDSSVAAATHPPRSTSPRWKERLVLELLLGRARIDYAPLYLERYAVEEFAARARRTRDAFAAGRFVVGIVGLAHQVTAFLGKE